MTTVHDPDAILDAKLGRTPSAGAGVSPPAPLARDPLADYLPLLRKISRGEEVEVPFELGSALQEELQRAASSANVKGQVIIDSVAPMKTDPYDLSWMAMDYPSAQDPSSLPPPPPDFSQEGPIKIKFIADADQGGNVTWLREGGAWRTMGRPGIKGNPADVLYSEVVRQIDRRTKQQQMNQAAPRSEQEYLERANPTRWNERLFLGTETGRSWAAGYNDLTGNVGAADAFLAAGRGYVDTALEKMESVQDQQHATQLMLSPDDRTSLTKAFSEGGFGDLAQASVNTIARQSPTLGAFVMASLVGGPAGAFAASTALGTGEIYQHMVERDPRLAQSVDKAAVGGLAYGVLDAASFSYITKNPLMRRIMGRSFLKEINTNPLVKRMFFDALKGGAAEGTTEAMQEVTKVATAIWADKNKDLLSWAGLQELFSPENLAAYQESFAGGALVGGLAKGGFDAPSGFAQDQMASAPWRSVHQETPLVENQKGQPIYGFTEEGQPLYEPPLTEASSVEEVAPVEEQMEPVPAPTAHIGPLETTPQGQPAGGVEKAAQTLLGGDKDVQVEYDQGSEKVITLQNLIDDPELPQINKDNYRDKLIAEGLDPGTDPAGVVVFGLHIPKGEYSGELLTGIEYKQTFNKDVIRLGRGSNLYTVAEEAFERNFKRLSAEEQTGLVNKLTAYEQVNGRRSEGSNLERLSHLAIAQAMNDKLHRKLGFKLKHLVDKLRGYLHNVVKTARTLRRQVRGNKVDPFFVEDLRQLTYHSARDREGMMRGIKKRRYNVSDMLNILDERADRRLEQWAQRLIAPQMAEDVPRPQLPPPPKAIQLAHRTVSMRGIRKESYDDITLGELPELEETIPQAKSGDADMVSMAMGMLDELPRPAIPLLRSVQKPQVRAQTELYDSARHYRKRSRLRRRLERLARDGGRALLNPIELISDTLERISPTLFRAMRRFETNYRWAWMGDVRRVKPFLDKFARMEKADRSELDLALKNRALDRIRPLLEKYDMAADWQAARKVLDDIHRRALEVGIDIGYLENYWPRVVEDLKGLRDHLHDGGYWSAIQIAIHKENAQRGKPMTDAEETAFINSLLRGYGEDRIALSGYNAAHTRLITTLTPDMNEFYLDAATGLHQYLMRLNEAIEGRHFFGKGQPSLNTLDNPIGAYVRRLIDAQTIKPQQEVQVRDILQARFSSKAPEGIFRAYKNITYAALLNNPITSMTQFDDLGIAWFRDGVLTGLPRALVNFARATLNRSEVNLAMLGFEDLAAEHAALEGTGRTAEWILKSPLSAFSFADRIGKETILNTVYKKYRRQAQHKKISVDFIRRMQRVFGDDTQGVIDDLRAGRFTENVRYLMANELLDTQPVALSEMPLTYLKLKNGKVCYTLKTYSLKRLSIIRREGLRKLRYGKGLEKVTGLLDLMRLATCLVLAGMGVDAVKDFLLGRKTSMQDRVIDNLFKMVGVPKYTIYQARREGPLKTLAVLVAPPFSMLDSVFFDAQDVLTGKYTASRTVRHIPFVGKAMYWWWGKGSQQNALTDRDVTLDKAARLYRSGQTQKALTLIEDFNRRYPGAKLTLKAALKREKQKNRQDKTAHRYPKDMRGYFQEKSP